MPEILNKTIHSFSTEDPQFPARNLLETRVTKKWKCELVGERSCFVILKLDKPRVVSGIDIGNEHSGFIEVLVANSKQDPPVFKEILLATSFMTIIEAKNGTNPNRVRCFTHNALVESVAKQKWDLVKIFCSQPFNNKLKYGLSFVTLHTPEDIQNDASPAKVAQTARVDESSENKSKFGKFKIRANSDSDSDDKKRKKDSTSPFNRWKSSKSNSQEVKTSIKEQVKTKIEENRKRIRMMSDSSDDDEPKVQAKPKHNRNRLTGLVYEEEDDEPNDKLQKKLDKDKAAKDKEKEQKTPKLFVQRSKTPPKTESQKSKFSSFISDDPPASSSRSPKVPSKSSSSSSNDKRPSSTSHNKHSSSSSDKKPSSSSSSPKKSPRGSEKKSSSKTVTYKAFSKLLEGVVFAFSGYVNPERGVLRQKALDMGAKYRPDWDSSCTHLICAFSSTPKYQQVKGKGKIVTKKWIETCFNEQKRVSWRRHALDSAEKDEPESEDEIHNILSKPKESSSSKSPAKRRASESDDEDMVVVDKRVKNGDDKKLDPPKPKEIEEVPKTKDVAPMDTSTQNIMEVSTDDEVGRSNISECDVTQVENQVFKDKVFYLNEDLSATDVIKLKTQIISMAGKITNRASKAGFIITAAGKKLPEEVSGEVLTPLWVTECHELEGIIPTTRYKLKSS